MNRPTMHRTLFAVTFWFFAVVSVTAHAEAPEPSANEAAARSRGDRARFRRLWLASYYKIGYVQLEFATAVMQAPRPKTLSADQRDQYDALLGQQMKPHRDGAEKVFRLTLERGENAGIENEWTARARSAQVEFGGAPIAAAPSVSLAPAANPNPPPVAVSPKS